MGPHRRHRHRLLPATCHAWAAGETLIDAVDRIKALTGRIDLVHCNDSRDAAGLEGPTGANFGFGQIDLPARCRCEGRGRAGHLRETADEGRKDDIAFLRENVD